MQINSKFDIVSVDNPIALAALAQILEVNVLPDPILNAQGTPAEGAFPPGAIVEMDTTTGKAVAATTAANALADVTNRKLFFVALDGNQSFSGRFVHRLTVLAGGFTMKTDQYIAGTYAPGTVLSVEAGKVRPATATEQVYGIVGPAGLDTVEGVLEVIVPQGAGL